MIIMAKSAGFCFGVKRAIKMALDNSSKSNICSLGPLIHNPREVQRLETLGVLGVQGVEDITGDTVIIRSHGVPPQVIEALKKKQLHIKDAT